MLDGETENLKALEAQLMLYCQDYEMDKSVANSIIEKLKGITQKELFYLVDAMEMAGDDKPGSTESLYEFFKGMYMDNERMKFVKSEN